MAAPAPGSPARDRIRLIARLVHFGYRLDTGRYEGCSGIASLRSDTYGFRVNTGDLTFTHSD
jgi:hypothetical protein